MITARLTLVARLAAAVSMALSIALGGVLIDAAPVAAFTGHGCSKATCADFTSSYHGSKYYYRRCDSAWKSLSNTYLQGFKTKSALLAQYPGRKLHKKC